MGEEYSDDLMEEMNTLQEKIDAGDLWDIDSPYRNGHGRPALPAERFGRRKAVGR